MSDVTNLHITQAGQGTIDLACADAWSRGQINAAKDLQVDQSMWMDEGQTTVTIGARPVLDYGAVDSDEVVEVRNNGVSTIHTDRGTMTINVTPADAEAANAIIEIETENELTLEITVTRDATATTCRFSEIIGNVLEAGHFYQVSVTGTCWVMADFGEI